jgi:hypothetical protein
MYRPSGPWIEVRLAVVVIGKWEIAVKVEEFVGAERQVLAEARRRDAR